MKIALLTWPDTFEDWYAPLGIDRRTFLEDYDAEWMISACRSLRAAGAEVHVVFGTLEAEASAVQAQSGATVHFVRAPASYRLLRRAVWGHRFWERTQRVWPVAPWVSTASPRLFAHLRALHPDVVVVQDYETPRFDVAAAVLPVLGLPLVGLDTGGSARPSRAPWKGWAARRARALLAVHGAEAARARRERRHPRVAVWPVPVRTDLYRPGDRAAARARLGVDAGRRIVLSAGRLHPVKGLPDLVRACAPLECELVLVGSGSEEAALRALVGERLRLTGRVPADELCDWYVAADVVALASRHEGQPAAVLEAFACGRGVVATAVGGVPDAVEDGVTGWLVAPRDVGALRTAIAAAIGDPAESDRRGAEGRRRVLARHGVEAAGRELLRLLAAVF